MDKERKMVISCLLLAAISSLVFGGEWAASVVKDLDALVSSCVVIPCSFTHPNEKQPTSKIRAIWHLKSDMNRRIYFEDQTQVLDSYKDRTKLLGQLGQNNCTLEITEIKDFDNGPFCFRVELVDAPPKEKFSFIEDCVRLNMLSDAPKPELRHPKSATQDRPYTLTCSVTHTCPSHAPKLKWSRGTADDDVTEVHRQLPIGLWEVHSTLTFIPGEKDDHSEITCTAEFHGKERRTSSSTMTLYIKRTENYNHIIIPTVVGIATAVVFGVLCIFMTKKYKKRIAELQSQEGSMWNRLSRMSRRIRSGDSEPSHSDHRRSVWSRFSRRPKGDTVDLGHMSSNVKSKPCADQKFSKPRFPSPKSQPKSCNYKEDHDDGDDYMNTADLNVYGNI